MIKRIAIVTGASSGIGKEFAYILAKDDTIDEIWAIARNRQRLSELKQSLSDKIRVFSMDLTDRKNIDVIQNLLYNENPDIKYLINSAGFAKFCDYADISKEVCVNMIDLNASALVALCTLCIPYMHRGAHIINMASQASFQPVPYQNVYSATKAFVRSYTRALNIELKNKDVCATAVCPGWMNTRLIERGFTGAAKATNKFPFMVEPYFVAQKAINDAQKNKDMSVYLPVIKLSHLLSKLLPQRLLMKIWLKQQDITP